LSQGGFPLSGTLLKQRWSPPLRFQVADWNTSRIVFDVVSVAVVCSESIKCFPGMASKLFKTLCYHSAGSSIYRCNYAFHVRVHCISVHNPLYFSFFSASFCVKFLSTGIATSGAMYMFSSLFLIVLCGQ